MPAPGNPAPPPPPRRSRRRASKVLSLPAAPAAQVVPAPAAELPPAPAVSSPPAAPPPPPAAPAPRTAPPLNLKSGPAVVPEVRRRRRRPSEWPVWARPPQRFSVSPWVLALALLAAVGLGAGLAVLVVGGDRTRTTAAHPSAGTVFLGAAALAVTRGDWPEAADFLRRARRETEPAVFAAAMREPLFARERNQPELAEFFPPSPPPPAGGTP